MTIAIHSLSRPRILVLAAAIALLAATALALTLPAPRDQRPSASKGSSVPHGARVVDPATTSGDLGIATGGAIGAPIQQPAGEKAMAAGAAMEPSVGVSPSSLPAPNSLPAPGIDQRIARTASISLQVKRRSFEQAWGDAQAVARTFGGFVVSSSRSGSGPAAGEASISIRVPSAKFDAAVSELRHVAGAKVEQLEVASQDVSQEYVDTTSRLRHDRAVEGRLLTLLAATKTVSEVLAVQARLDNVQAAIEVSMGRIKYLDSVTSMSTIDVTLHVPAAGGAPNHARHSTLAQALRDAGARFVARVSSGIIWVGGALPVLMLLGFLLLAARFSVHRYRAR